MLFLFTWEEKFLLQQKLNKWKNAFIQKYDSKDFYSFRSENIEPQMIASLLMWGWLFDEKKLIVVYGLPKDSDKSNSIEKTKYDSLEKLLMNHIDYISSSDDIVILVSYKADKRWKLYKFITSKIKEGKVKEELFPLKNARGLLTYIKNYLSCDEIIAKNILNKTGANMQYIHNEISKLKVLQNTGKLTKITSATVEQYITDSNETDSFKLLDSMKSNKEEAISILDKLKKNDEDIHRIMGLIHWHIRSILLVVDQKIQWADSSKKIASVLKLHPFVASKIMKSYNQKDIKPLLGLHKEMINIDYGIKIGQINKSFAYLELKKSILSY